MARGATRVTLPVDALPTGRRRRIRTCTLDPDLVLRLTARASALRRVPVRSLSAAWRPLRRSGRRGSRRAPRRSLRAARRVTRSVPAWHHALRPAPAARLRRPSSPSPSRAAAATVPSGRTLAPASPPDPAHARGLGAAPPPLVRDPSGYLSPGGAPRSTSTNGRATSAGRDGGARRRRRRLRAGGRAGTLRASCSAPRWRGDVEGAPAQMRRSSLHSRSGASSCGAVLACRHALPPVRLATVSSGVFVSAASSGAVTVIAKRGQRRRRIRVSDTYSLPELPRRRPPARPRRRAGDAASRSA